MTDRSPPSHLADIRFGLGVRGAGRPLTRDDLLGAVPSQAEPAVEAVPLTTARVRETLEASRAMVVRKQGGGDLQELRREARERRNALLNLDAARYCERLIATDDSLRERLVLFWTDHFAVTASKGFLRVLVGPMVDEAIRPHVYGRFPALLRAAVLHPAMLYYLDNVVSIGPNSRVGRRRDRGLNENLAREILELHTMGVGGGYHQGDVTALARVLTGVKVPREAGETRFRAITAEPGTHEVAGWRGAVGSLADVHAALDHIALHPATARHVTGKLAEHFVGSDASAALRDALALRFTRTGGDLAAVMRTLLKTEEAWELPLRNVRPPLDFVVATARLAGDAMPAPAREDRPRASDAHARGRFVQQLSARLGQRLWYPPSPAGYPGEPEFWLSAAGLTARLDWAGRLSRRLVRHGEPLALLERSLGPVASGRTRTVVARAPNARTAIALLLGAPEFNMR